jgi:sulfatase modifying factor 1
MRANAERFWLDLLVGAAVATAGTAGAVTMEWVTVGDPGNAADTAVMNDHTTGYGSVSYAYRISKYEVTNAQYAEFLNAVASSNDFAGLYDAQMSGPQGGIVQNDLSAASAIPRSPVSSRCP